MNGGASYEWLGDLAGLGAWAGNLHAEYHRKRGKKLKAGKTHLLPIQISNGRDGIEIHVDTSTGTQRAAIGDFIVYDGAGGFFVAGTVQS